MRYPHYLRPAKGGRWPQRVLIVECEGTVITEGAEGRRETEALRQWRMAELYLSDGEYHCGMSACGQAAAGFWCLLAEMLVDTRSTWLLSEGCGRIWPLIGLWQQIECGRVTITGRDPYADSDSDGPGRAGVSGGRQSLSPVSSGRIQRARDRLSGMLVVADPPCVLSARVGWSPGDITWLDARNYAVQLPAISARGPSAVQWLIQLWRDYHHLCVALNLGSACATTGSQSLHGWRVGYYTGGVYAGGTRAVTETEVAAVVGGRTECFRVGQLSGPVYHLDIRSAYGAMCVQESVPIRICRVSPDVPLADLGLCLALNQCIASVRIRTEERAYPCTRDGRTIYPVGEYDTVLCGPELADAYGHDRILRCYSLLEYDDAPIMRDYARAVYLQRCLHEAAGRTAMASVCKALLVGIVGKFAQRDRRWTHCPDMWTDIMYGEWYGATATGKGCRYRSLAGVVQRDDILGLSSEAVPAVTAWIMSAARMMLLRHIRTAGWDHVYYCDTDSLMVDHDGFLRLCEANVIQTAQLGYLYVKGVHDHVDIRGAKYYVEDGSIVCAGLPRGRCVDAADGLHYWYDDSASVDAAHHCRPGAARTLRRYERRTDYHGGIVRGDGRVDPIVMG